jgi:hypothetical protein
VEDPLSEAIIKAGGLSNEAGTVARIAVENDELRFTVLREERPVGVTA